MPQTEHNVASSGSHEILESCITHCIVLLTSSRSTLTAAASAWTCFVLGLLLEAALPWWSPTKSTSSFMGRLAVRMQLREVLCRGRPCP